MVKEKCHSGMFLDAFLLTLVLSVKNSKWFVR